MTVVRIPVDSAEAQEFREAAAEQDHLEKLHAGLCVDGLLGDDASGHPIACPWCRPHLFDTACTVCYRGLTSCAGTDSRRPWPCCEQCNHPAAPGLADLLAKRAR